MVAARYQILLASPQLKEIEEFRFELRGSGTIAKRPEINCRRKPDVRCHLRARKVIREHQLHVRRKSQSNLPAIILAQMQAREFPEKKVRFEAGTGVLVFDALDGIAYSTNHAQQTPPQYVRPPQMRLPLTRPQHKHGGPVLYALYRRNRNLCH
jgi:hypothetical protein